MPDNFMHALITNEFKKELFYSSLPAAFSHSAQLQAVQIQFSTGQRLDYAMIINYVG